MIRLTADHHFTIGQTHLNSGKPCQDYALSGVLDGAAFALVADGCSGGRNPNDTGPHVVGETCVGARLLVHAAANAVRTHWAKNHCISAGEPTGIMVQQGASLLAASGALGLNFKDLQATTSLAYLSPAGGFVHLVGDGVIAYKKRDEDVIEMHLFDWEPNMPFYPVYGLFEKSIAGFIRDHGGDLDAIRMSQKAVWYDGSEFQNSAQHTEITLRAGMRGITHWLTAEQLAELEYIAIFTDGVTQFKDRSWTDIVHALLAIQSREGEFMKRRLGRVVKEAQKSGHNPMDDVGVAVIRVVQIPDEEDAPC